ncbi:hypothetical protein CR513_60438, partial [Mucuna pruriens]
MQHTLQQQTKESSELASKMSVSVQKMGEFNDGQHKGGYLAVVPRSRPACTCSNRPGSARCARHGYVVPGEKKRRVASKEILRRALTPPPKRLGLRWLNFRPTPNPAGYLSYSLSRSVVVADTNARMLLHIEVLRTLFNGKREDSVRDS